MSLKAALTTTGEHGIVDVDALGVKAVFLQQLQPFAATTPQIDRLGLREIFAQRLDERQIDLASRLDRFARATKLLLERIVEGCVHSNTSSSGGNQAEPVNPGLSRFRTLKSNA